MKVRDRIEAVKQIPTQIKLTLNIAIAALFVAFIALAMSGTAVRRAH